MHKFKYGKREAAPEHVGLRLADYAGAQPAAHYPASFGFDRIVGPHSWGMLGNDEWGDCALAGPAHETMLITGAHRKLADGTYLKPKVAKFTTSAVLSDYSAVTGFDPNAGPPGENPTDNGSMIADVIRYRQHVGILDAAGNRHTIGAGLRFTPGNLDQLAWAVFHLEVAGIGIQVPASAQEQFAMGQVWDVVPGSPIEGGHYVPVVARVSPAEYVVVTWGRLQKVTARFLEQYCDEAWAYVSPEMLQGQLTSPRGFNLDQLNADLQVL